MLFSSQVFLFAFLPVALVVFYLLAPRFGHRIAACWLVGASLFFYGWWNPRNLPILLASILFNFLLSATMARSEAVKRRRVLVTVGVVANLSLLAYYKYSAFFLLNLNHAIHANFPLTALVLPLGISFFTFTQTPDARTFPTSNA